MGMGTDPVKWKMDHLDRSPAGFIAEFVPQGQTIKAWKEMVAQQITFTNAGLSEHIKQWKGMITTGDPDVIISEETSDSSSITISYKSKIFNEYSIRKFTKGSDGIYALAYHARLNRIDPKRVSLWTEIIADSDLIRNPEKR
ncbi:MAG: hypothetical protein ACI81V_000701 [Lentimonas sp.]|jgi:hypothetical protein